MFEQNNNFTGSHIPFIKQTNVEYGEGSLNFYQVLHKYYLIATLGRQIYPFRHIPNIIFLFFLLKFRKASISRIIDYYSDIFEQNLLTLSKMIPKIDIMERRLIWEKSLLAFVLTSFINLNIFNYRKFKKSLEDFFYLGLYVGMGYVVADSVLDSEVYSEQTINEFNEQTLKVLAGFLPKNNHNNELINCIIFIYSGMEKHFPRKNNEYTYKMLYLLEKAQFEDLRYRVDKVDVESIIHKTSLVSLKALLCFLLLQSDKKSNMFNAIESSLLWSLYCQLFDDLRDISEDREANIQTLFTVAFDEKIFNPNLILTTLTQRFGLKYKANWMYNDLVQVLKDNKSQNTVKHDERKIKIFIEKMYAAILVQKEKQSH